MLNRHNLNIAKLADESRYAVIQVRQDRTVVTNGHYLMHVTTPKFDAGSFPICEGLKVVDTFEPFTVEAETALKAAKDLPKKTTIPVLGCAAVAVNGDPTKPMLVTNDLERIGRYAAAEGNHYPDWEKVMPKPEDVTLKICLDAKKLKVLLDQFIAAAETKGDVGVTFSFVSPITGVTMTKQHCGPESDQTVTAVLMPMRSE